MEPETAKSNTRCDPQHHLSKRPRGISLPSKNAASILNTRLSSSDRSRGSNSQRLVISACETLRRLIIRLEAGYLPARSYVEVASANKFFV